MDDALIGEALATIEQLATHPDPVLRDRMLSRLSRHQAAHVPAYARLCAHRGVSIADKQVALPAWPALPTDVFRYTRVASHDGDQDVKVFRTSGTTSGARGAHHLRHLATYDRAAELFARQMLFPDVTRMRLLILVPHANDAPDSSLSYMLTRFLDWFGTQESVVVWRDGGLDVARLAAALDDAAATGQPVALLGTSFAFVHAEDALGARRWQLPRGSRLMQTGGYKGKSREVDPDALRDALGARYGIAEPWIVQEYGMTELCSQLYESTIVDGLVERGDRPRRLIAPPWMRVTAVDPESLAPVPDGQVGIARIDDLANVDSVCAIQTADRIRVVEDGIVLFGRAPGATPRGCSLAVEEALG